ncbi:MAG TPA: TMEM165/GDT1 family protein, partial [Nitrococcus sp.]|nr:TMEM165/GDT1 family protein [Nitrococcus sp.]
MDPLFVSALAVAAAEIGDKTQLLTLLLTLRYRRPWLISIGILLATLANHAGAALAGEGISRVFGADLLRYLLAASFVLMGLWLLRPDRIDAEEEQRSYGGVLASTCVLFFLAEMGDKTQIATVALGAQYNALIPVVAGTTLGMLIANVPVAFGGQAIVKRLPVQWIQRGAAALFIFL